MNINRIFSSHYLSLKRHVNNKENLNHNALRQIPLHHPFGMGFPKLGRNITKAEQLYNLYVEYDLANSGYAYKFIFAVRVSTYPDSRTKSGYKSDIEVVGHVQTDSFWPDSLRILHWECERRDVSGYSLLDNGQFINRSHLVPDVSIQPEHAPCRVQVSRGVFPT